MQLPTTLYQPRPYPPVIRHCGRLSLLACPSHTHRPVPLRHQTGGAASAYEGPTMDVQTPGAKRSWRATNARWLCAAIVLVLNLAFYAKAGPTLRLVELAVCREYYAEHDPGKIRPDGGVDESECKLDGIQSKVAWLFMADELLHFVCGETLPSSLLRLGPWADKRSGTLANRSTLG